MHIKIKNTHIDCGVILVCAAAVSSASFLQNMSYDISAGVSVSAFFARELRMHLFGSGVALMVTALMVFFTGRAAVSCLISSVFCAVFSVFNHFVLLYSGQPFWLSMIAQAGTALDVAGRYSYSADETVVVILAIFLINLGLCLVLKRSAQKESLLRSKKFLRVMGLCCALLMMCCAEYSIYKNRRMGFLFLSTDRWLQHKGYIAWALTGSDRSFLRPLRTPPGYGEDEVLKVASMLGGGMPLRSKPFPDIILILNETLFDLNRYVPVMADVPYLANWYAAKNAFRGHSLSPSAFGGTNDSEFELLTSHPDYLAAQGAPMTTMDLSGVHSIAVYLKELGYETWAVHPCPPSNYNREAAWTALGFDHTMFEDDFSEHEFYGNRRETDAANYRDMIRWYESAPEGPRFFFMLTFQNHGGYEQNDESLDTVHSLTDFGKNTPLINEYLTSIRMSDEALADLLKYFESVERPALVCIMGDHAPSFCRWLKKTEDGESSSVLSAREVPLMIWANPAFGSLNVESAPAVSMTDVMPLLLRAAGLPLSPYYEYLLDVARDIPIRERDGTYIRADGAQGRFEPGDENYSRLLPLYSAAYADLAGECADLREKVFSPPAGGAQ